MVFLTIGKMVQECCVKIFEGLNGVWLQCVEPLLSGIDQGHLTLHLGIGALV